MKRNGRAVRLLRTWREDYARRTLLSAGASFACTALFAVYNGYLGIRCGSVWHKSIAGFYLLLTAVRGSALLTERRVRARPAPEQERCRRRTFLVSSVLLLVLDLALILPVSMMVVLEKPVDLGLIPAIAMAAYTPGRSPRPPCTLGGCGAGPAATSCWRSCARSISSTRWWRC